MKEVESEYSVLEDSEYFAWFENFYKITFLCWFKNGQKTPFLDFFTHLWIFVRRTKIAIIRPILE